MSAFAAWGMSILGLAVICSIAEMLLPQGKTRSVIRSVMATVTVLVIITPLPELIKNGLDFEFATGENTVDAEYVEYSQNMREKYLASAAQMYLEQNGYTGVEVQVELSGFTVKSVALKISDSGIMQNGAHINKSEITKLLAEYFGIEKEAVMAYG